VTKGLLVAFEGLDQSGKQTQAELLRQRLIVTRRRVRLLSFPDYQTPIGIELGRALRGEHEYAADVMQLLYVANRYEWKDEISRERDGGTILVCDRYLASSVAYGEAHGLDGEWLTDIQKYLPQPDLTILLDIPPAVSARRKTLQRDKYERDLSMLARVRESYLRQAKNGRWQRIDADRDREAVSAEVFEAISALITGLSA
jgi:dTMP kinase